MNRKFKFSWAIKFSIFCFSVVISFLLFWGFFWEPSQLNHTKLTERKWKGENLRVVFFSDLHVGSPFVSIESTEKLVEKINVLNPDLILIGGDLLINGVVGGKFQPIEAIAPVLGKLKARLGVFSVLGNHDWWNNGFNVWKTLEQNGINVLENESVEFLNTESKPWHLVGIGDHMTNHTNVDKAFQFTDSNSPKIIFMHDPGALLNIPYLFDIALAGHMHGGQVFIPGFGAPVVPGNAPRSWAQGWTQLPVGKLFVSNGIGTSILPVRFGAKPEFVVLDLLN